MRRLTGALALRVGARGIAAAFQAVTLILMARELGPADFGVFGQAQSIGIFGAAIFSFGLSTRSLRLAVDDDPERIVSGMFVLRFVTAATVSVLIAGVFYAMDPAAAGILLAVAVVLFADMMNDLMQGVLSGLERQKLASVLLIAHRLLPFSAVLFKPFPDMNILAQFVFGCGLAAIAPIVYTVVFWAKPVSLRALTRGSSGFWLSTIAGPVSQFDTTIVRLTSSVTSVGYYAAAARVGAPLNLISSSLVNIVVPAMTREPDAAIRIQMFVRLRRLGIIFAGFIIVSSPMVAELVVRLLGEQYRPGWPVFCGMIIAAAFSGISQMYQAYFFAINLPRIAAVSIALGTVIGLAVLGFGSALWGVAGLAAGPVAMQLAILVLFGVSFSKQKIRALESNHEREMMTVEESADDSKEGSLKN